MLETETWIDGENSRAHTRAENRSGAPALNFRNVAVAQASAPAGFGGVPTARTMFSVFGARTPAEEAINEDVVNDGASEPAMVSHFWLRAFMSLRPH